MINRLSATLALTDSVGLMLGHYYYDVAVILRNYRHRWVSDSIISLTVKPLKRIYTLVCRRCRCSSNIVVVATTIADIGVRANFYLGKGRGLSHLCPNNISTVPEKTAMLTCTNNC